MQNDFQVPKCKQCITSTAKLRIATLIAGSKQAFLHFATVALALRRTKEGHKERRHLHQASDAQLWQFQAWLQNVSLQHSMLRQRGPELITIFCKMQEATRAGKIKCIADDGRLLTICTTTVV